MLLPVLFARAEHHTLVHLETTGQQVEQDVQSPLFLPLTCALSPPFLPFFTLARLEKEIALLLVRCSILFLHCPLPGEDVDHGQVEDDDQHRAGQHRSRQIL